jgi:hypothetical protein
MAQSPFLLDFRTGFTETFDPDEAALYEYIEPASQKST